MAGFLCVFWPNMGNRYNTRMRSEINQRNRNLTLRNIRYESNKFSCCKISSSWEECFAHMKKSYIYIKSTWHTFHIDCTNSCVKYVQTHYSNTNTTLPVFVLMWMEGNRVAKIFTFRRSIEYNSWSYIQIKAINSNTF